MSGSKADLRKHARETRAKLAIPDFASRAALFATELQFPPNAIVAGYWPVRDEADPRELMKALALHGATLSLPRIDKKHSALSFRMWREGDVLVDNHHGIAEPRADEKIVTPDVLLVPLLAFDLNGHRLGYGGGYYDRTLAHLRARSDIRAVGIAYAGQEVEALPHEAHDQALDLIITERGVHQMPGTSR